MYKLSIEGNKQLHGKVIISGSKNAALPIFFMTILTKEKIQLSNVPNLKDIKIAIQLLKSLGAKIINKEILSIDPSSINTFSAPFNLINKIRASIWMLAPLLSRFGRAQIFLPGGCKIGTRPIDLHINALIKLGAKIHITGNIIYASIKGRFQGTQLSIKKNSVGATITAISAAVLADGRTTIHNASQEPEIVDLVKFLNMLGSNIIGAGSNTILIEGVNALIGGMHKIIPDRIETGTFLVAATISQGNIICKQTEPKILTNILKKLIKSGARIKTGRNWIHLDMRGKRPKAVNICTLPYPGFPTDMQPQFALLNSIAEGKGTIKETIFENRFQYTSELIKMGARLKVKNNHLISYGVSKLLSNQVICTDLRASATLILAGCISTGITIINEADHIFRGYELFLEKLNQLGANIKILH